MDEVELGVAFGGEGFVVTARRAEDAGGLWRATVRVEPSHDVADAGVAVAGPWAPWDGHPLKDAGFVTYKECLREAVRVIRDYAEPGVPVPVSRAIPPSKPRLPRHGRAAFTWACTS